MKKTKRTLAIILALIMVLSVSVFAAWNQVQGNDNNNGQITDTTPPPVSPSPTITNPPLNFSGGGWSGVDTTPVMETIDGVTYAYVTYNGRSNGTQLSCINCNTGTVVWSKKISSSTGANQLSTPYLDTTNGIIYVAATDYYWYLQNPEFTSTSNWSLSNGTSITVGSSDDTSYVTIPSGGSISQSFNNATSGTISTQLTSGIKLVSSGTSATVTFNLTKPDNSTVQLATKTITSDSDWEYVEETGTGKVSATGTYTVTVSVSGASVIIDYVSFSHQTAGIKAYNRNGTIYRKNVATATYGGQINTPLYVYGNYLYFGTYNGSKYYYQVNLNNTNTSTNVVLYQGNNHFYWAGVYSDGTNVAFGGDGGYLYYTTSAAFGGTGTQVYSLNTLGGVTDAGNVRSSLCKYGNYVYFTSQGGNGTSYLWRVYWPNIASLTSSDVSKIQLSGGSSTSTPAISTNGYIYVGTYGSSSYSNNGVRAVPVSNFSASAVVNIVSGTGSSTSGTNYAVQSSMIVYSANTTEDYIYFTTNQSTTTNAVGGRGYCYKHNVSTHGCTKIWNTAEATFTLQGMAACGGYVTFGNDADTFYVIH